MLTAGRLVLADSGENAVANLTRDQDEYRKSFDSDLSLDGAHTQRLTV